MFGIEPKYIMAAFVTAMIFFSYYQGYKMGARATYQKIMRALGVPKGSVITGVSFTKERK